MTDKLQDTLAALQRGERPECPWCGAPILEQRPEPHPSTIWLCGNSMGGYGDPAQHPEDYFNTVIELAEWDGKPDCCWRYELKQKDAEFADLRAEVARLRGLLNEAIDWMDDVPCEADNQKRMPLIARMALAAGEVPDANR